jgi:hypothetical protein
MPDSTSRIALIHATPVAMPPIHAAFAELWPEASPFDILESALSTDADSYPEAIVDFQSRFLTLTRYAHDIGAKGVLFTCSAFGSHIDKAAETFARIPVMKPNEAMFAEALVRAHKVAMIATFAPAVPEMKAEFGAMARKINPGAELVVVLAEGAIDALRAGADEAHDRLCAEAAQQIHGAEVLMLAHFSTARARLRVAEVTDLPVLTSPHSAVRKMQDCVS